jgi:hypothetical protein
LVLADRVLNALTGEVVLELKGGHRQAIDEQGQVEGAAGLIVAVSELAGKAEAVEAEQLGGAAVAGGGRAVEELDLVGAVADALAQHFHHAALGDLFLQPGQELPAAGPIYGDRHGFGDLRLSGLQKTLQLHQINAVAAVVVSRLAQQPTGSATHRHSGWRGLVGRLQQVGAPGHGAGDQRFQSLFAGVRGHGGRGNGAWNQSEGWGLQRRKPGVHWDLEVGLW